MLNNSCSSCGRNYQ